MLKSALQNTQIVEELARIGHTDYIVIGDIGLPVPDGVKLIDLAVARNLPRFLDVLRVVAGEMVFEGYIHAQEYAEQHPPEYAEMQEILAPKPGRAVSHEEFKQLSARAKAVIRTGECVGFSNVILIGGVDF